MPDWYVKTVKDTTGKRKESAAAAGSSEVPAWAKDMTDGMGMDKDAARTGGQESAKADSGKAVPHWVKDTLDDPTLKATVAAGEAQEAADSLAQHEREPAPMPAPQPANVQETAASTQEGASAPLPTPAPPPAAPPPVPEWAKAGGNTATGFTSRTASSGASKGKKPPPPVPDWAKDFVADS